MKAPEKAPHNNGGCTLRSPVSPSSQTRRSQILYQFLTPKRQPCIRCEHNKAEPIFHTGRR